MSLGQYLNHLILEADTDSSELSDLLIEKNQGGQRELAQRYAEDEIMAYSSDKDDPSDLPETWSDPHGTSDEASSVDSLSEFESPIAESGAPNEDVQRIQEQEVSALRSALNDLARYDDTNDLMSSEQAYAPDPTLSDTDDDDLLYSEAADPQAGAFASARSMMSEIAERLERIEDDLTSGSDSHWTERIEDIADQVERSETYMVGGLLAVEKALTRLDNRTEGLEKNQQSVQKIGGIVEHLATHFQRFEASTGHKIDTIAEIVTELDDRVNGLEHRQSHNGVDPLGPLNHDVAAPNDELAGSPEVFDPFATDGAGMTQSELDRQDTFPSLPEDPPDLRDPSSIVEEHKAELAPDEPLRSEIGEMPRPGSFDVRDDPASSFGPPQFLEKSNPNLRPDAPAFSNLDGKEAERDAKEARILESFLQGRTDSDYEINEDKYPQPGRPRPNVLSEFRASTLGIVGASFLALAAAGYFVLAGRNQPIPDMPLGAEADQLPPILQSADPSSDGSAPPNLSEQIQVAESRQPTPPDVTQSDPPPVVSENPVPNGSTIVPEAIGPQQASTEASTNPLPPNILTGTSIARLEERAQAGDENAQLFLGIKFLSGSGVQRDEVRGADLITQAAATGSAPAQYRLGALYEQGVGVSQDYSLSKFWYEKAALSGNRKAMHNLAVLYAEGKGVPQDYAIAAQWFGKAADLDLTDSQYNLGILLKRGFGVEQDYVEAYKWFDVAARKGDQAAQEQLEAVTQELDPVALEQAGTMVDSWEPVAIDQSSNFDRFF